jgi:formylglycine-generating enzyme required for sulfatase activity
LAIVLAATSAGLAQTQAPPGDANCDLVTDGSDVGAFVLALVDPAAYEEAYPSCQVANADLDCDGSANTGDISDFVECLLTGNCVPCGACCYADETCEVTREADCSGTWQEAGTDCTPNPCPQLGACCNLTTGGCSVTTQAACSGSWTGGGTCTPNPCPPPTGMVLIPAGEFMMGDTFNEGGADERPVHAVNVGAFYMHTVEVTNGRYVAALNWALAQGNLITVTSGVVYKYNSETAYPYCSTTAASSGFPHYGNYSRITWNGSSFGVVLGKQDYPMAVVSWYGAVAYANWRSGMQGLPLCYNLSTWTCDFANGYRLPTEAEWEKAARGGTPGHRFPWSDTDTIQHARANYRSVWSGGIPVYPYDTSPTQDHHPCWGSGSQPYTGQVRFFTGALQHKADWSWPGSPTSYQTANSVNGYGLYDMCGNVWEWCNDWYSSTYYTISPYDNPHGPESGTYRALRGGGWYSYDSIRVAHRLSYGTPEVRNYGGGFRLVLNAD